MLSTLINKSHGVKPEATFSEQNTSARGSEMILIKTAVS
jgi:hypothetical protein